MHILEAIRNIQEFVHGFDYEKFSKDKILQFAIIKNFEIIGEAANAVSRALKDRTADIGWREMIGLRHVLVHGYFQISNEIIWNTIANDLSPLKDKRTQILEDLD